MQLSFFKQFFFNLTSSAFVFRGHLLHPWENPDFGNILAPETTIQFIL